MESTLLITSLISLVSGITMSVIALQMRTESAPPYAKCLFNPKCWRPVWRMKDWFTPLGYRLNLLGTILIVVGCTLGLLQGRL